MIANIYTNRFEKNEDVATTLEVTTTWGIAI